MYYVYILFSKKHKQIYIGSTPDLKRRFLSHNAGKNLAIKRYLPWSLFYYEAYSIKELAIKREYQLKRYGKSLAMLKKRIGLT
ncbi:MAG: GIY-YIG nuclease family protein [Candidatus Berkelbacteria bacterium]